AKVFVRKPALFRTKKKRNPSGVEPLSNKPPALLQIAHLFFRIPPAEGVRAHKERKPSNTLLHELESSALRDQWCRAHRRTRIAKRQFVGIHHTQMQKAKIAHRAGRGADVQRIPRVHQHHAQPFVVAFSRQGPLIYNADTLTQCGALTFLVRGEQRPRVHHKEKLVAKNCACVILRPRFLRPKDLNRSADLSLSIDCELSGASRTPLVRYS